METRDGSPASRRAIGEILALGVANGVFLGAGFMAPSPLHAVLAAMGAGSCISLAYLFVTASRRA